MMFAFGDNDCISNQITAKKIENYLKNNWLPHFLIPDSKQINEVLLKNIYNAEIEAYKRMKNIMKDIDEIQNKEVEYDISFIPKEDLDENLYQEDTGQLDDEKSITDGDQVNSEEEEEKNQLFTKDTSDVLHEERTSFYSNLVEAMDEIKYDIFSKCRLQNFMSRGKDALLEWFGVE